MNFKKLCRLMAIFLMAVLPITVLSQSPNPTASLNYPFTNADLPNFSGTPLPGNESVNRCSGGDCGWRFLAEANYEYKVNGVVQYYYDIYHPGWDMNVTGTGGGTQDTGTKLKSVADGIVIAPTVDRFNANKKTETINGQTVEYLDIAGLSDRLWNEILIKHNVGGKEWITAYGHSRKSYVKAGDVVQAGDLVAEMGSVGTGSPHLHLEIRDYTNHPDPDYNRYWDWNETSTNQLHILSNVQSWYYHPELFIKGFPAIGRTSTGSHSAMLQFVSVYLSHQGSKTGSHPWDTYQYWDQVVDRGPGYIYVHNVPNDTHADRVALQDLKNVQDATYAALIYNQHKQLVFYSDSTILSFWFANSGYTNYGPPVMNQEKAVFVDLNSSSSYYGDSGKDMIRQGFSKQADGNIKTIIHMPGNPSTPSDDVTEYRAVGSFQQGAHNGVTGLKIYEYVNGVEKRWPSENTTVVTPTARYFVPVRDHQFRLKDANGNNVHAFTYTPIEGNHQFSGDGSSGVQPVTDFQVTIQGGVVSMSWTDDLNIVPAVPYGVIRNGNVIGITTGLSFVDNTVMFGQTYTYTVSTNNGPECSSITVTIPNEDDGSPSNIVHVQDLNTYLLDYGYTDTQKLLIVMNANSQSGFSWTATPSESWITLSRTSGTASSYNETWGHHDSIMVTINRSSLADFTQYQESISIGGSGGSQNVPVIVEKNTVFEGPITYSFNTGQGHWIIVYDPSGLSGLASSGALKLADNGKPCKPNSSLKWLRLKTSTSLRTSVFKII